MLKLQKQVLHCGFLPKVHSLVYSAEPVSIVNRLSESESKAAAAAAAAMVGDLDEA